MSGNDQKRLTAVLGATANRRQMVRGATGVGLALPALLASLHGAGASGATRGAVAARAQGTPKKGGTFVCLGDQEVVGLSPEDADPTVVWAVVCQIHNALYTVDENNELQPDLAESHTTSPDGKTWTFKLRSGVTFHNGDAFTSADVKYTYDWIMDEKNASTRIGNFNLVDKVEAPDPQTVVVTLKQPSPSMLFNVGGVFIYPAKYHAEVGETAYKAKPIGTGPFKLKEWKAAERTTLDAFDGHFRGRPNVDEFRMDVVPEASGRMAALEAGKADTTIWPLGPEDNQSLKKSGKFTAWDWLQGAINHFPLNNNHPFLSDNQARKAMMYAIDRQGIVDDIFQSDAVVADSNMSPAYKWHTDDVTKYEFDPDKARQTLEDAGWTGDGTRAKDGQKAAFECIVKTGDTVRRPEAEIVQQFLKDIGVDMQLREEPSPAMLQGMRDGSADAALFNWTYGTVDPDATNELSTGGANNFSQYSNPKVDELLQQGLTEVDEQKRIEIYQQIQKIITEDVPFLYILILKATTFYANRIKGVPEKVLSGDNYIQKVYQVWIEE